MKKLIKKNNKTNSSIRLFATCICKCSGCGSVPSWDYNNVKASLNARGNGTNHI